MLCIRVALSVIFVKCVVAVASKLLKRFNGMLVCRFWAVSCAAMIIVYTTDDSDIRKYTEVSDGHDGKQYPHKYEPLITRKLFNQCLDVKKERGHAPTKAKAKPYTLKTIVKCGRCGRAVSSYVGRKQVYLRCAASGSKSCGNPNVAERHLIPSIEVDLGMMKIPERHIGKVIDRLKSIHENQQQFYTNSIDGNRLEYDTLKQRLSTLYEDRLDGRITAERYDEMACTIERKQQDLNDNLKDLTADNKSFLVTTSYLLDLCQRGNELFKRSNPALRQQLLQFVLSNVELNDKLLSYTINDPFREVVELNKLAAKQLTLAKWQGRQDLNLRHPVLETGALPTELLPYGVNDAQILVDTTRRAGTT